MWINTAFSNEVDVCQHNHKEILKMISPTMWSTMMIGQLACLTARAVINIDLMFE
jgi:hypothetical protein